MVTVWRAVPLVMTTFPFATFPFATLPLAMSPLPVTLGLVPIRRPPRTLVDHHRRCLVDRTRLNVDRLGPDERLRQRRRHEDGEARKIDRDILVKQIEAVNRSRCA